MIDGGDGVDTIVGGDGGDRLFGGNGGDNDTINVGFFPGDLETFGIDGRDGDVDVIVAAGSFADNGTDTVLNYDESTHTSVTVDDVFDFSDAFDFDNLAITDEAAELNAFLTYDQPSGEIRSAGDPSEVWFDISELENDMGNTPEQVTVLVDGQMFLNDGTASGWIEI